MVPNRQKKKKRDFLLICAAPQPEGIDRDKKSESQDREELGRLAPFLKGGQSVFQLKALKIVEMDIV